MAGIGRGYARALAIPGAPKSSLNGRLLLGTAAIALLAQPAHANPAGGNVSTGSASISSSSSRTTVDQKSEGVVINWSSFNVGSGQTTNFVQPNSSAIAVNRIGSASASQILGTLDANGRIVLINGNGLLFGKGAQVNVGSLIATSTDGSDSDLLAGKFTNAGNQNASVVNRGTITAAARGTVALVAPNVSNSGIVQAKLGTVSLGAVNAFTVDFAGDGLVSFAAQGDVNGKASAVNTGRLTGANVAMTAHAAEGVATGVVSTSGFIQAEGVSQSGGTIFLDAGNGTLTTSGTINAAGGTGGGQIETSGAYVSIAGAINAGKGGKWIIDPDDLTIDSTAAATIDASLNSGNAVELQTTATTSSAPPGNAASGVGDINIDSALSWGTNAMLTIDAYHSINILAPITIAGAGSLVLQYDDEATDGVLNFGLSSSGFTGNISYGATDNGGTLSINGAPYALLYSMSDVQNINNSLTGNYALATSLDASGVASWVSIGTNGSSVVLNSSHGFAGIFEGLGNTISNLTISSASPSYYSGLFGDSSGTLRDIGVVGGSVDVELVGSALVGDLAAVSTGTIANAYTTGSVSGGDFVGGLVGEAAGTITDAYATGSVSGSSYVGGLVGISTGGSITDAYATGSVIGSGGSSNSDGSAYLGGLVGANGATITDSHATGSVSPAYLDAGGLAGENLGTIMTSYATGVVDGAGNVGGLVGENTGAITDSYATGLVGDLRSGSDGGLVGDNTASAATITGSYATGAVSGTSDVGGLVGSNSATITDSYATGAVSGTSGVGGLVGANSREISDSYATGWISGFLYIGGFVGSDSSGTYTGDYWDIGTSGFGASAGAGNSNSVPGLTGLHTADLQGTLQSGLQDGNWSIGAGLYPYLTWQFPSGTPQVVSGLAYRDTGKTADMGATVSVLMNGNTLSSTLTGGSVAAGANGYYYYLLAPGTISGTEQVLAYTAYGAALYQNATGSISGLSIYGTALGLNTTASSLSTTSVNYASDLATAEGSNSSVASFVAGLPELMITSSAPTYTIDTAVPFNGGNVGFVDSGGNLVVTAAQSWSGSNTLTLDAGGTLSVDAPITISGAGGADLNSAGETLSINAPITISGTGGVDLNSAAGALSIDAPITVSSAGSVALNFLPDAPGAVPLSFGLTSTGFAGSVNYGSTNKGGTFTINGTGFTLLYSMSDVQNINSALGGNYALATSINAATDPTTPPNWTPIGTDGSGNVLNSIGFTGVFEGLGNTISNLTVNTGSNNYAGLFGFTGGTAGGLGFIGGTIRDLGIVGGSVTGGDDVGGIVGFMFGSTVANSFSTASVSGDGAVGGFAGGVSLSGSISDSYATGSVSATGATNIGGFVGLESLSQLSNSYATGSVSDPGGTAVGGFTGATNGGSIADSYATGSVSASGGGSEVGGFTGQFPSGSISDSYSTGYVTAPGATFVGGFVGLDGNEAVTDSYWDMDTSGFGAIAGAGNVGSDPGITGLHTAALQGTLQSGFSNTVWSTGAGLYPYLNWQFNSTPQVVSGTVLAGTTEVTGKSVGLLVGGNSVAPALATTSGADGYYYDLVAPGTISNSGSDVVAYLTSGTPADTWVQGATGSVGHVELVENSFVMASAASDSNTILSELPAALGSASGPQFLYTASSGIVPGVNLVIFDAAPSFTLDSALDVGNATLTLYTTGSNTQNGGAITANELESYSTGGLSLTSSTNSIAEIGLIGNVGTGGISITDAAALTVEGVISTGSAGSGTITLTTTGTGHGLTISGHLTGGTVDLVSAGTISEGTSGYIDASTLEGSSDGNVTFLGRNEIGALDNFTTNGAGAFDLYDFTALDVAGTLNTAAHTIKLVDEVGNLDIDGTLDGGTVTLDSVNGDVQGAGTIDAKLLNVTADTGIDLDGANDIVAIGTDTTSSGTNVIDQH